MISLLSTNLIDLITVFKLYFILGPKLLHIYAMHFIKRAIALSSLIYFGYLYCNALVGLQTNIVAYQIVIQI